MIAKSTERLGTGTRKAGRFQRPGKREERPERASSAVLRLGSPGPGAYAGSKWGESPAPAALPRPPTHWTRAEPDFARGLKMLLNVQVQA